VIVDHGDRASFEAVVEARDLLLKLGKDDHDLTIRGCHVVAPVKLFHPFEISTPNHT
jgi:ribosomal protein RSM22 (predicted rRNA methylase)